MSPRFEELVVFAVITVLVALFAWIHVRDRQKSTGLWMLGWIAILVHFAAPALDDYFPRMMRFTPWIMVCTLIAAATCFLLSVSEVFLRRPRRIAFGIFISCGSTALCYRLTVWFPITMVLCFFVADQ